MRRVTLLCLTAFLAHAQTFDVASLKPAAAYKGGPIQIGTSGGPGTGDPGRLTFSNATLMMILTNAFNVESYQISGPVWLNIDMFDVAASVPPGTTKEQMRMMLQNLAAERFKMTTHRERQEMPSYALTVGKGGPKMKVADPAIANEAKTAPSGVKSSPDITRLTCNRCTMDRFVGMLGTPGGHQVFDATGLTGTYDFVLVFEPDYGKCKNCVVGVVGGGDGALPSPAAPQPSLDSPPILAIAVQQQLGLKLEQKKMPVDVIVIDHIEKTPTGN